MDLDISGEGVGGIPLFDEPVHTPFLLYFQKGGSIPKKPWIHICVAYNTFFIDLATAISSHQAVPPATSAPPSFPTQLSSVNTITSQRATSSTALVKPSSAMPELSNRLEAGGLEREIARLAKDFEDLVDSTEESFVQSHVSLKAIQKSVKHIPISLQLELGDYFRERVSDILNTKSIEELFILLSVYWDYLNPGVLEFLVKRFGSDNDKVLLQTYIEELVKFQPSVKLGDFLHATRHTEISAFNHYRFQRIITIMEDDWERQTLEDVQKFRKELANEHRIQPSLFRTNVKLSSIAIVFCLPHWIRVEMDELEPLLTRKKVVKVFLDDVCLIDWTKQV